mgnify:CR=1 FL=1
MSSSDEYKIKYNIKQKNIFDTFVNKKPKDVIFSLANAHGSILDKTYLYDMIRPGIGIYGCYENKQLENKIGFNEAPKIKNSDERLKFFHLGKKNIWKD